MKCFSESLQKIGLIFKLFSASVKRSKSGVPSLYPLPDPWLVEKFALFNTVTVWRFAGFDRTSEMWNPAWITNDAIKCMKEYSKSCCSWLRNNKCTGQKTDLSKAHFEQRFVNPFKLLLAWSIHPNERHMNSSSWTLLDHNRESTMSFPIVFRTRTESMSKRITNENDQWTRFFLSSLALRHILLWPSMNTGKDVLCQLQKIRFLFSNTAVHLVCLNCVSDF